VVARPEKSKILHLGYCALIWIAKSTPEIPGIATSDMTRSGDSRRAAASASSGEVKNLAERPFIFNMAARLDAITGSSSTMKTRELERGDKWGLFRVFLRVRWGAEEVSVMIMSSSRTKFCSLLLTFELQRFCGDIKSPIRRPGIP
jgi:hypothetical protein